MLPTLDRSSARIARPVGWLLAVAAVTVISLPAFHVVRAVAAAPPETADKQFDTPPAQAEKPAAAVVPNEFRAELPSGAVIEILGVGEHPSHGKLWWSAAGEPANAPYAKAPAHLQSPDGLLRELAVRVTQPEGVEVQWEAEPSGSAGGGTPLDANGRPLGDLTGMARVFPRGAQTCSIRIGVAYGPWQNLYVTSGRQLESAGKQVGAKQYGFAFSPAYEQTKDAHPSTTFVFSDNVQNQDVRVVALSSDDGVERAAARGSRGGAAGFSMTTVSFPNLPLAKIDTFRIEVRPFHWYEIRNVSLHPGKKTEPKLVELEHKDS